MNESLSEVVTFVLVNTTHAGNIGAAARAMKTMGFSRLRLVNPCRYQTAESLARASGADGIVRDAEVFSSLPDAIGDCQQVYGTSARSRTLEWSVVTLRDAAHGISDFARRSADGGEQRIAIVFGRERSGLTNDELSLCQHRLWIPANPEFSSLNLGSAVQVVAYELAMAAQLAATMAATTPAESDSARASERLASAEEMEHFHTHLEQTLVATGFLDPDNPRQLLRRLRRYFGRNQPTLSELQILRGILSSVQSPRR